MALLQVEDCRQVQSDARLLMLKETAEQLLEAAEHVTRLVHVDHECDISLRLIHDQAGWLAARLGHNAEVGATS